ncbi:MAG: amidohydrolase family protein [Acidobacteria bacterium]|nr:amidohydrolase family protein [Acidobacteriota bacterium]
MAVRDGKVFKLGNNADIRALAGPQTRQIDLKGRMVVPSFSMTHEHPVDWMWTEPRAFLHVFPNDNEILARWLPNISAKEQFAKFEPTMKELVAKAKPGQWIRVVPNWGPDYERAEEFSGPTSSGIWGNSITKEYLDTLAPNNPVCISGGFTSACMSNAKAVEIYRSVHENMSEREQQSGRLGRNSPSDMILKNEVPQLAQLLKSELELWARSGITAYGSAPYAYTNLQAMNLLDQKGEMPARIGYSWQHQITGEGAWELATLRHLSGMLGQGSDYMWFVGAFPATGGGCMTVPEKPGWREAAGLPPQTGGGGGGQGGGGDVGRCGNEPGTRDYNAFMKTVQAGLRIATVHTGGDKAIDYLMDAIEEGGKKAGFTADEIRAKRHAFDHGAGAPRPEQIPRMKNLGMMVGQINTIIWETHRGAHAIARQYGLEYTNWVVPRKMVNDAGIMNSFEIDRPLPHKVFFFVLKGMNRFNDRAGQVYGASQKTDRITQLKALTTWGGYYLMREKRVGMLDTGSYADFLVLDRDFLTIPEADIPKIDVLMTVVGGKPIHLGATLAREIGMQPVGPDTWREPIPSGWEPKPY